MKKLGLGLCLSAVMALTSMAWAAEQPQKKETPPDLYEGTPDWYRAVYKDNVGLKEGSGPFKDYFKPQMLDMYWQPNRHYEPMKNLDHSLFIEKERRDLCVTCHEEATPGVVSDWRSSGHKNPKSTPYLSARTAEIEKRTNRVLNEVHCFDCHADTKTKQIRMPTGEVCGECHRPQFDDFLREREVGRPNHIQSWEANTIVPWYAEAARRGYLYGQHGCDQCHSGAEKCDVCHTRHKFSAAEGRQPEACISCHMGPDHPDSESYGESKHGVIYEKEEDHFDFNRPLSEVRPGKDYRTPTCQYCHMYEKHGRFIHNPVMKGIWRMGTVPPKNLEYTSSLKGYPYGIKIIADKIDIYSEENIAKRSYWLEVCAKCHSDRFADTYLKSLDEFMFQAHTLADKAQKIVEDLIADGFLYPGAADRDPYPLSDGIEKQLSPAFLGEPIYNAFKTLKGKFPVVGPILGVYGMFLQQQDNPSNIENMYNRLWFWYKLQGYKGTAHAQPDISWWWGQAPMMMEFTKIQSEAVRLRREGRIEKVSLSK